MKKIKLIFAWIFLSSLFACIPPVTFTEPQPTGTDNLSKFPKRIQGKYRSLEDYSILSIGDKEIQRIYDYDYKVHPNQLDSNSILSGDTIIDLDTDERTMVRYEGDSLVAHVHFIETLFQMDYDNVVRKFRGYYFLNTRYEKNGWAVKKIQLSKGQLVIGSISTKSDIEQLKEITESLLDTVPPYKFTVNKQQFKKFVKKEGFSDRETFIRLK